MRFLRIAAVAIAALVSALAVATVASGPASAADTPQSPASFRVVLQVTHPYGSGPTATAGSDGTRSPIPTSPINKGCREGYVCLYTDNTNQVGPSHPHTDYYYYGYDNFSNVQGRHPILNNQTGAARLYLCTGYNGTECTNRTFEDTSDSYKNYIKAGYSASLNFTPINSIVLCAGAGKCPS